MRDYLPTNDKALLSFALNFQQQISEKPSDFGLTAAQVAAYAGPVALYDSLLDQLNDPVRASPSARERKTEAKEALTRLTRTLVRVVQAYPPLTDGQRKDLRIRIPDRTRTRRPAPSDRVVVEVTGVSGRRVFIRLRASEGGRGKPKSVREAQIFSCVSPEMPTQASAWEFRYATGRVLGNEVVFEDSVPNGASVWVGARWANTAGVGPFSKPILTNLPGGAAGPPVRIAS